MRLTQARQQALWPALTCAFLVAVTLAFAFAYSAAPVISIVLALAYVAASARLGRWRQAVWIVATLLFVLVVLSQAWGGRELTQKSIVRMLSIGIPLGSVYALAASGITVTYTTSGIFNFAQGAIGMLMAFVYWDLRSHSHFGIARLSTPFALFLVVLVIAPLFGALIERILIRYIVDHTLVVQLVVTIALMVFLMGLTNTLWAPTEDRYRQMSININRFGTFFGNQSGFHVGDTLVTWHRFTTVVVAVVVAILLRLLLYRTRIGITMRAVVDNRDLAALNGARPDRASMLSWAIGSSLASMSGILLAPELGLQVDALTLLIINAFAAAIVGRLRSLPWTYVGGLVLGLIVTFSNQFLDLTGRFTTVRPAIPTIFLFVVLLALPQARLELRKAPPSSRIMQPRDSTVWETALGMAALFAVMWFFTRGMGEVGLNHLTLAITTAIVMLSLVPLTGWAGQVSLAQVTFAGVGAFAMWKVTDGATLPLVHWTIDLPERHPLGLVAAAALAVPVGALLALPALRLQGLYLALASMAFALMAESLIFNQPEVFSTNRKVERLQFFGHAYSGQRGYLLLSTVMFGLLAVGLVWVRRSRFGRRMVALRDSEAACATVGISRTTTKFAIFTFSAAIAGFGGAMLGMHRHTLATTDYKLLAFPLGITLILGAVVGGIRTVSGALFGGFTLILFQIIQKEFTRGWFLWMAVILGVIVTVAILAARPTAQRAAIAAPAGAVAGIGWYVLLRSTFSRSWLVSIERLGPGFLAINISRYPNGASVGLGFLFAPLLPWRKDARQSWKDEFSARQRELAARDAIKAARKVTLPAVASGAPSTAPSGDEVGVTTETKVGR